MLCGWAYANCTMQGLLHGSVRDSCISELYIRAYPQWSAICGHCPTCLFSSPSTALHKPQTNSGNAFFIGHSRNTVLIWRRWEKLNQITLTVKKTDFGNENWEGCRSTEVFWPIRCFQSEKDFPPQEPDTAAAAADEEWSVMTSCKGTSDWRVWLKMARGWCGKVSEAGRRISADRQRREHYSLLEKGDSSRLWFAEEASRLSRETAKSACDFQDMCRDIALISEHVKAESRLHSMQDINDQATVIHSHKIFSQIKN